MRCFYLDRDACAHPIPYEMFVEVATQTVIDIEGHAKSFEGVDPIGLVVPELMRDWCVVDEDRKPFSLGPIQITCGAHGRRFFALIVPKGARIRTRFGQMVEWTGEELIEVKACRITEESTTSGSTSDP